MAKYEATLVGNYQETVTALHQYIMDSAFSMRLVDDMHTTVGDVKIGMMVYDKFYMRSSGCASLSITVIENGQELHLCAISSGGGAGIFSMDFGAEENFVSLVKEFVEKNDKK